MHRGIDAKALFNSIDDINLRVHDIEETQQKMESNNKLQRRHTTAHLAAHDGEILKWEAKNNEACEQLKDHKNKTIHQVANLRKMAFQGETACLGRAKRLQHDQDQLQTRIEAGELRCTTIGAKVQDHEQELADITINQTHLEQRLHLVEEATNSQLPALQSDMECIFERLTENDSRQEEHNGLGSRNRVSLDQELRFLEPNKVFTLLPESRDFPDKEDVDFDTARRPLHLLNIPAPAHCKNTITSSYDSAFRGSSSNVPLPIRMDFRPPSDPRHYQNITAFFSPFLQPSPTATTTKICDCFEFLASLKPHALASNTTFRGYIAGAASCVPLGDCAIIVVSFLLSPVFWKQVKTHQSVVAFLALLLSVVTIFLICHAEQTKTMPPAWSMGDGYVVHMDLYRDSLIYT